MKVRTLLRWVRRGIAGILAVVLVVVVLVFAALRLPPVQQRLGSWVSDLASAPGVFTLDIEGLSGPLPSGLRVERLAVGDGEGEWLVIEELEGAWSLLPALSGSVRIERLTASAVRVLRVPVSVEDEEEEPDGEPFDWREDLPDLLLAHLAIGELELAEPVLGQAARFQVTGSTRIGDWQEARLALELAGLGAQPERLSLQVSTVDRPLRFDARLEIREGPEGTLVALMAQPDLEGIDLELALEGPLEALSLDLNAALPGLVIARLEGEAALEDPRYGLVVAGTVDAREQLSALVGEPVVDPVRLDIDAHFEAGGRLEARRATLNLGDNRVSLVGDATWGETEWKAAFALDASGRLLPALSGDLVRSVDADLEGSFEEGVGRADLKARIGGVGDLEIALESVAGEGDLRPFELSGNARLADLFAALTDRRIDAPLQLTAGGAVAPGRKATVALGQLTVGGSRAKFDADIDLATFDGTVNLLIEQDEDAPLAGLIAPAAFERIDIKARAEDPGGSGDVTVEAEFGGLRFAEHAIERLDADLDLDLTKPGFERMKFGARLAASGAHSDEAGLVVVGSLFELDVRGDVDLGEGAADFEQVTLDSPGLKVAGTVSLGEKWQKLDADLDLDLPTLVHWEPVVGSALEGKGTISLDADANLANEVFAANVDSSLAGLGFEDPVLADLLGESARLTFTARGRRGEVTVETLAVEARAVRVHGKGSVVDGYSVVDAEIDALLGNAIEELAEPLRSFTGGLRLASEAKGPLDALVARIDLAAEDLAMGGHRLRGLELASDLTTKGETMAAQFQGSLATVDGPMALSGSVAAESGGGWKLAGLRLVGAGTDIAADLAGGSDGTLAGDLKAAIGRLATFSELAGRPLAGSIELVSTLARDADGGQSIDAKLSGTALSMVDAVGATVSLGSLQATVDVDDALGAPRGSADVVLADAQSFDAEMPSLRLRAASRAATWDVWLDADVTRPQPLALAAAAAIEGFPSPEAVRFSKLDLDAADVAMNLEAPFAVVLGTAPRIDGMRLAVEGGGFIEADGRLAPEDLDLRMRVDELPLALLALVDQALVLEGALGLDATVSGRATSPRVLADLKLRGVSTKALVAAKVPPLAADVHADLAGEHLQARLELSGLSDTRAVVLADLPVGAGPAGRLSIKIDADADLEELMRLYPVASDEIRGQLLANLTLGGTINEPTVDGSLRLQDGYYESGAAGTILQDLVFEAVGEGQRIVVSKLEAGDGGKGKIGGEGYFDLSTLPGWDFEVSVLADKATLTRLDVVTSSIDGSVTVRGNKQVGLPAEIGVRGRIEARKIEVNIPNRFGADVSQVEVLELNNGVPIVEESEEGDGEEGGANVALNLRIVAENRIYVRGRGLDSEWRTGLFIEGTGASPEIQGKVSVVRGTMSLLGKRFELSKGNISFAGAADNEPDLDIRAEADAGEITAFVDVTGTPSNIAIEFSSEPALPRDEVLSYVLFGEGAGDLTPLQSVQLAQSLAALSGRGGGPGIFETLGSGLGLDKLGVNVGAGALTAGKYLTDDVYINVEQGLTPESSKVGVEWEVTDNVTVESDLGQNAQGEIGVNWSYDY